MVFCGRPAEIHHAGDLDTLLVQQPEGGRLVHGERRLGRHPGEEAIVVRPLEDRPHSGPVGVEGALLDAGPGLPDDDGGRLVARGAGRGAEGHDVLLAGAEVDELPKRGTRTVSRFAINSNSEVFTWTLGWE